MELMKTADLWVPETLTTERLDGLAQSLQRATTDDQVRVIILRGPTGVFCSGMDLSAAAQRNALDVAAMARCLRALHACGKPTIAAVDGQALGGGVGIAAACDYVVATERATFGLPELLVGLVPATILPVLAERMPAQRIRRLALLGHAHSAIEACGWGLVDEVVASDTDALERAVRRAARRLSRAEPGAVALLKTLTSDRDLDGAIGRGAALTEARLQSTAVQTRLRKLAEGEQAPWSEWVN
jgi:enoyl-CoA hydratase/carnithine racemase